MALPLAPGDIMKCRVWCADAEQASVNTYYFLVNDIGTPAATDSDLAQGLDTLLAPLYKAIITNDASYRGVEVQIASQIPLPVPQFWATHTGAGTAGTPGLPRQAAGLVSFRTTLAGPGHRGRVFLPFVAAASNRAPGQTTTTYIDDVTDLMNALTNYSAVSSGGRTATVQFGIFSKKNSNFFALENFIVAAGWATQRRRGSYGRPNVSPI